MSIYGEKLTAFLDGELPEDEEREIEAALARDPALQAELDELMEADVLTHEEFGLIEAKPDPLEMAAAIRRAPVVTVANAPVTPNGMPGWVATAMAVFFLFIGGTGGYLVAVSQGLQVATTSSWLTDIAGYHSVYAAETRHLVEVPANEAEHITAWLTKTVGADVRIPDLSSNGLEFQGARLLVAAGKPVAQLMYTDVAGKVVALCLIRSDTPSVGFTTRTLNGFDMISWSENGANVVVIGDEGRGDLSKIAANASAQI